MLTAGKAHDVTAYDELMEQRDSDPGAMLADKGYDSDAIRRDLQDRGSAPEIPTKSNRKVQRSVTKRLYRLRSRIECFIGHLKEQRRIATRYDRPQPASSASSCSDAFVSGSGLSTGPRRLAQGRLGGMTCRCLSGGNTSGGGDDILPVLRFGGEPIRPVIATHGTLGQHGSWARPARPAVHLGYCRDSSGKWTIMIGKGGNYSKQ